jgi:twitching motility protein PilT
VPHATHSIDDLLTVMVEHDASDLHVTAGSAPVIRVRGRLERLPDYEQLTADEIRTLMYRILSTEQQKTLETRRQIDFSHSIPGLARFRVNAYFQRAAVGAAFRLIPDKIKTLEELGLPTRLYELADKPRGLVLVTGPTGSGKSTTLASLLDHINHSRREHILTIEDPIEFVHARKQCLISQREVGVHTKGFAAALQSGLREDPDVVLVGELRDYETISIAVTAAEMGILVMGTLHTNGAAQTVDRMINVFPADKQGHVRTMLSTSLRGVISQQLLQKADKSGRVAALEILVNTPAVSNLIRQGKLDQLETTMQSGSQFGMRTMDNAIEALLNQRLITGKEAYKKGISKAKFEPVKDQG